MASTKKIVLGLVLVAALIITGSAGYTIYQEKRAESPASSEDIAKAALAVKATPWDGCSFSYSLPHDPRVYIAEQLKTSRPILNKNLDELYRVANSCRTDVEMRRRNEKIAAEQAAAIR